MSGPIYFHLRLRFPTTERILMWQECVLLAQYEYLESVSGFDSIAMGDDDLLGHEITVTQVSTLEEALTYLEHDGFHYIDRTRIIEWGSTVQDGEEGIQIVEAGTLARSATVGDLLAHLQSPSIENGLVEALPSDSVAVVIHGFLPNYDAYREYRLPMIYAGAAACQLGAAGSISFVGPGEEPDYVATFADFEDGAMDISEPDPQDLSDEELVERFGGIDFETVYHAWKSE